MFKYNYTSIIRQTNSNNMSYFKIKYSLEILKKKKLMSYKNRTIIKSRAV